MCGSFPTIIFSGQHMQAVGKLEYLKSGREYLIFCTPVNDLRIVGRRKMCLLFYLFSNNKIILHDEDFYVIANNYF